MGEDLPFFCGKQSQFVFSVIKRMSNLYHPKSTHRCASDHEQQTSDHLPIRVVNASRVLSRSNYIRIARFVFSCANTHTHILLRLRRVLYQVFMLIQAVSVVLARFRELRMYDGNIKQLHLTRYITNGVAFAPFMLQ
jgi:hypothetical protein